MDKRTVVVICGSMAKAALDMESARIHFERQGCIVLLPTDPASSGIFLPEPYMDKDLLCEMHFSRIDLADIVYICNAGGYIGPSTQKEIQYARSIGKTIQYAHEFYDYGFDEGGPTNDQIDRG
jgi:hypothetical protein